MLGRFFRLVSVVWFFLSSSDFSFSSLFDLDSSGVYARKGLSSGS